MQDCTNEKIVEYTLPLIENYQTISDNNFVQKVIEFSDNRLMIDLCGQLDSNLSRVENAVNVQIVRRGNILDISGLGDGCKLAITILQSLYAHLEAGKQISIDDLEIAIRMPQTFFEAVKKVPFNRHTSSENDLEIQTRKKSIIARSNTQKEYIRDLLNQDISFGIGPAGTGKTYLAIGVAVSMYLTGEVNKIILTRPAVEAGERLGFLPGDMKDKVDPYMQPLYDALSDCLLEKQITKLMEEKLIEIAPLAFMRGRTLSNAFIVLDEAQNTTTMQMKMFLTRLGTGSHMAITGDITQIDLPLGTKSGLVESLDVLKGVDGIGFSMFSSDDVVRHGVVTKVIKAYEKYHSGELSKKQAKYD